MKPNNIKIQDPDLPPVEEKKRIYVPIAAGVWNSGKDYRNIDIMAQTGNQTEYNFKSPFVR